MNERELLRSVASTFEALEISYFVTGQMASITLGEPRFTNDIDVVADIPPTVIARFLEFFPLPDFYLSEAAVRQAVRDRFQFNIRHTASGLTLDVIIPPDTQFNRLRMERMIRLAIDSECEAWFASPEDVILKKLEYFREGGSEKHLRDISRILKFQGNKIDRAHIEEWAARLGLLKEWRLVQDAQTRKNE